MSRSKRPARRTRADRWLHRLQRAAQLAAAWLVIVLPSVVWAADGDGPTTPDALGNLLNPPPGLVPAEGKSLFEFVGMEHYVVWSDLGVGDVVEKSAVVIYAPVQLIAMLLVRLGIAMSWWLDRLTQENDIADSIGSLIQSSASLFNTWLLPSALAVGALIAYGMVRRGQSALSQLAAVVAIGVFAVGLAASGTKIVNGLDTGRSLLSNSVGQATGAAMTTTEAPLRWPANYDQGTPQQQLARKSGDTIWRTFAVTMWCESQFGSMQACEQYGPAWLQLNNDEERKRFVEDVVSSTEGGGDSPTVRHMQGHQPSMRITVALFSLVLGAGAGLVIAGLSMVALMSWILALLMLALAAFFACIMVIPGRPRRWGLDFFNTVIAATIGSALVGGILWATLAATGALAALVAPLGFLPMAVLAFAVLLAGWKSKSLLEGVLYSGTSMRGQGDTGMRLASFVAARAGIRTGKRATRAVAGLGGMAARGASQIAGMAGGTPRHSPAGSRGAPARREAGTGRLSSLRPAGRTDRTGSGNDPTNTKRGGSARPRPSGPGRSRPQDHGRYSPNRERTRAREHTPDPTTDRTPDRGPDRRGERSAAPRTATGKSRTSPGANGASPRRARDTPAGSPSRGSTGGASTVRQASSGRSPEAKQTRGPDATPATPAARSRFVQLQRQPRTPGDGRPARRQPPTGDGNATGGARPAPRRQPPAGDGNTTGGGR